MGSHVERSKIKVQISSIFVVVAVLCMCTTKSEQALQPFVDIKLRFILNVFIEFALYVPQ